MLKKLFSGTFFFCLLILSVTTATAQSGHRIHLGGAILTGDDNTSARFQLLNSFAVTPRFSAGAGAGFTYYNDPLSLLPVFAELNYALTPGLTAPYLFLRAGYNFSILTDTDIQADSHRGGLMLNPGVGLKVMTREGLGLHLSAAYNLDRASFSQESFRNETIETQITYKRLMLGMALSF
jgi:hypothetical protein